MDDKLKIYINAVVPGSDNFSGRTGSVVRMGKILIELTKTNENIRVIINATQWMADYFRESGVADVEYRIVKSSLKFKNFFGLCLKSLILVAKSFFVLGFPKGDKDEKLVVYSSSDLFWEVIPAYAYKIKNKKIEWVQIIHHIYPNWRKRQGNKIINFFGYSLQRFSLRMIKRADKIIVVNSIVKGSLLRFGIKNEKIFINPNGIDYAHFQEIGKSDSPYDGVFLARLSHSKGIFDLVEIWKRICHNIPEASLAVIGGGDEETKKELVKKISESGLSKNIEIKGFLPDKEAHLVLKSGRVFIFPSHEEGWGIAVAEAMACGLPVVSWDLPNYKPVFENHTMQIKENDIEGFSKKVIELLQDDNYRTDFGDRGREFVKKYSWENVAKEELEIIKR